MNPLTNMKNVTKLSEQELYTNNKTSWHDQYRDSAWVFIGGLPYDITEGDIICIFSQWGEVVNINLIRDKDNGKSKGFCFLCYEDQRSTVLAVDNFNGIRVINRILRVDHVSNYKIPKQGEKTDQVTKQLYTEGCGPQSETPIVKAPIIKLEHQNLRETLADQIQADIKLPARLPIYPIKPEPIEEDEAKIEEDANEMKEKLKAKGMSSDKSSAESENNERKGKRKNNARSERDGCEETKEKKSKDADYDARKSETSNRYKFDDKNRERNKKQRRGRSRSREKYGKNDLKKTHDKYKNLRRSRSRS